MVAKEASENFRLAQATMTQDELACNYCGAMWEPVNEREERHCPNCHRNPSREYVNAPLGDVPLARVRMERQRLDAKINGDKVEKVQLPPRRPRK